MLSIRKTCLALALSVCLIGSAHAQVVTGEPAPDFKFTDIAGHDHSIAGLKGKIVVLEWTNPGCPFVKKWYSKGDMQKLQTELTKDPNVVWVSINSSGDGKEGYQKSDKEAQAWTSESHYAGTAYVRDPSGAFGRLYGAKTTPHMFVIDKDGKIAYQGAIDSIPSPNPADIAKADNYVSQAVVAIREGKAPKTGTTTSYGCGVKYADPAPAEEHAH